MHETRVEAGKSELGTAGGGRRGGEGGAAKGFGKAKRASHRPVAAFFFFSTHVFKPRPQTFENHRGCRHQGGEIRRTPGPRGRPAGDARAHSGGGEGDRQQVSVKLPLRCAPGPSGARPPARPLLFSFRSSLVAHHRPHRPRISPPYVSNHRAAETRAERYGEERHTGKEEEK